MSSPVFLLRPRGERVKDGPDVALLPMGRDRALLLLTRIDQVRETVARDPDMISVQRRERADVFVYSEGAMNATRVIGLRRAYTAPDPVLLHLPRQPFHPRHELVDLEVSIEILSDAVCWHLLDTRDGTRFKAGPLTVAQIAHALLRLPGAQPIERRGRGALHPSAQLNLPLEPAVHVRLREAFLDRTTRSEVSERIRRIATLASNLAGVDVPPELAAILLRAERAHCAKRRALAHV